jgi:hypothetical protein
MPGPYDDLAREWADAIVAPGPSPLNPQQPQPAQQSSKYAGLASEWAMAVAGPKEAPRVDQPAAEKPGFWGRLGQAAGHGLYGQAMPDIAAGAQVEADTFVDYLTGKFHGRSDIPIATDEGLEQAPPIEDITPEGRSKHYIESLRDEFPMPEDASFLEQATAATTGSLPFIAGYAAGKAPGAAMVGYLMNRGAVYDEAIAAGADQETARKASRLGGLIGTTEALPIDRLFRRVYRATRGKINNVAEVVLQGGTEALQEMIAQPLGNWVARKYYDEFRKISEGVGEGGLLGGAVGTFYAVLGIGSAKIDRARRARKEGRTETEQALKDLEDRGAVVTRTPMGKTKIDTSKMEKGERSAARTELPEQDLPGIDTAPEVATAPQQGSPQPIPVAEDRGEQTLVEPGPDTLPTITKEVLTDKDQLRSFLDAARRPGPTAEAGVGILDQFSAWLERYTNDANFKPSRKDLERMGIHPAAVPDADGRRTFMRHLSELASPPTKTDAELQAERTAELEQFQQEQPETPGLEQAIETERAQQERFSEGEVSIKNADYMVDAGIAGLVDDLIDAGFVTLQSHSGLASDHGGRKVNPGSINFYDAKQTSEQNMKIRQAAMDAGMTVGTQELQVEEDATDNVLTVMVPKGVKGDEAIARVWDKFRDKLGLEAAPPAVGDIKKKVESGEYVYHAANKAQAERIRKEGLAPRSYFAQSPGEAANFIKGPAGGANEGVVFAIKKSDVDPDAADADDEFGRAFLEQGVFVRSKKGHQPDFEFDAAIASQFATERDRPGSGSPTRPPTKVQFPAPLATDVGPETVAEPEVEAEPEPAPTPEPVLSDDEITELRGEGRGPEIRMGGIPYSLEARETSPNGALILRLSIRGRPGSRILLNASDSEAVTKKARAGDKRIVVKSKIEQKVEDIAWSKKTFKEVYGFEWDESGEFHEAMQAAIARAERQRDVAQEQKKGKSEKQIADALGISIKDLREAVRANKADDALAKKREAKEARPKMEAAVKKGEQSLREIADEFGIPLEEVEEFATQQREPAPTPTQQRQQAREQATAKPATPAQQRQRIRHFTKKENVTKILEEGYHLENDPIHGTGAKGPGKKTGRAGEDVLYFTTDDGRWSSAEVFVGEGKGDITSPAYDYANQKWIEEKDAYKKVDLSPVEAEIREDAKILTIDSLAVGEQIVGQIDKHNFIDDVIAQARKSGYDIVNIKDPGGEAWVGAYPDKYGNKNLYESLTGNSGKDDYFILNRDAIDFVAEPTTEPAPAASAAPATEPQPELTAKDRRDLTRARANIVADDTIPESVKAGVLAEIDSKLGVAPKAEPAPPKPKAKPKPKKTTKAQGPPEGKKVADMTVEEFLATKPKKIKTYGIGERRFAQFKVEGQTYDVIVRKDLSDSEETRINEIRKILYEMVLDRTAKGEDVFDKMREQVQMYEDNIATKKSKGEKIPVTWLENLAALQAKIRGAQPKAGEVFAREVFGHPLATSMAGYQNLIPIRVRDVASVDRRIAQVQKKIDKLQEKFGKSQVKGKGGKKGPKLTIEEDAALEMLKNETMPELGRLRDLVAEQQSEPITTKDKPTEEVAATLFDKTIEAEEPDIEPQPKVSTDNDKPVTRNEKRDNIKTLQDAQAAANPSEETLGAFARPPRVPKEAPPNPYAFSKEGSEQSYQNSRGFKPPNFIQRAGEAVVNAWHKITRPNEHLAQHGKKGKQFAVAREVLRIARSFPEVGADQANRLVARIVESLGNPQDYDLFNRYVILLNAQRSVELRQQIPLDFDSLEEINAELDRFQKFVDDNPRVQKALDERKQVQEAVVRDLIERNQLPEHALEDYERYYHQQVLHYQQLERAFPGRSMRERKAGFQHGRVEAKFEGQKRDEKYAYNTEYVEAESTWIRHALIQISLADARSMMQQEYDISKKVKDDTKAQNWENFVGGPAVVAEINELRQKIKKLRGARADMSEADMRELGIDDDANESDIRLIRKGLIERLESIDPTYELRKKMAIGIATVEKEVGYLPEDSNINAFMAAIAKAPPTEKAGIGAKSYLSAINERRKMIEEGLGDRYIEWHQMIPEGYRTWQPRPGNVWYEAVTIPDQIVEELEAKALEMVENGEIEGVTITKDDMRSVIALGGKHKEWVIPDELANQLESMDKPKEPGPLRIFARELHKMLKVWLLHRPKSIFGYMLRNFTGDLDAVLAGAGFALKEIPDAKKKLLLYHGGKLALPADLRVARDYGVLNANMSATELVEIKQMPIFRDLYNIDFSLVRLPARIFTGYFDFAKKANEFRENILRLAAYQAYLKKLNAGTLDHYGGSSATTVKQIQRAMGNEAAAAHLSRNLLGDYGNLSGFGNWMRATIFPFYSWVEVNTKRYPRLFQNAFAWGRIKGAGNRAASAIFAAAGIAKIFGTYALINAFNRLMFPEEEDQLSEYSRSNPHITLGRNADGTINVFRNVGALGDFLEWAGINSFFNLLPRYHAGQLKGTDLLIEMVKDPVNKLVGGLHPAGQLLYQSVTGQKLFPDVFNPRSIDRTTAPAAMVGMGDEWSMIRGKAFKEGRRARPNYWKRYLVGVEDPRRNMLNRMHDKRRKFLEDETGASGGRFPASPTAVMRYAVQNNDFEAFQEAKRAYIKTGKTPKQFIASVKAFDPLYGKMNNRLKRKFIFEYLNDTDRRDLDIARRYAQDIRVTMRLWWVLDARGKTPDALKK